MKCNSQSVPHCMVVMYANELHHLICIDSRLLACGIKVTIHDDMDLIYSQISTDFTPVLAYQIVLERSLVNDYLHFPGILDQSSLPEAYSTHDSHIMYSVMICKIATREEVYTTSLFIVLTFELLQYHSNHTLSFLLLRSEPVRSGSTRKPTQIQTQMFHTALCSHRRCSSGSSSTEGSVNNALCSIKGSTDCRL